jgi:DNA mismatch endonuclease, patch repair protein
MADVVSADVRSRMMSGIRGKNTKPEMIIRRGLHARGFRYILHDKRLPGKPDLVLPKYRAVIFINGCFWHGHNCHLFKWPKTRPKFWLRKIERNREIDQTAVATLKGYEWRCCVVWECALKSPSRLLEGDVVKRISKWLRSEKREITIRGGELVKSYGRSVYGR